MIWTKMIAAELQSLTQKQIQSKFSQFNKKVFAKVPAVISLSHLKTTHIATSTYQTKNLTLKWPLWPYFNLFSAKISTGNFHSFFLYCGWNFCLLWRFGYLYILPTNENCAHSTNPTNWNRSEAASTNQNCSEPTLRRMQSMANCCLMK